MACVVLTGLTKDAQLSAPPKHKPGDRADCLTIRCALNFQNMTQVSTNTRLIPGVEFEHKGNS